MGEFFRGWRRKIGVVTLAVALVFMGGWVRGQWKVDQLYYVANTQSLHVVYSCPQGIGWTRFYEMKAGPILNGTQVGLLSLESMDVIHSNWIYPPLPWSKYEWCPQWLGLRVGTQFAETPLSLKEVRFWIVPYGMITIPLTLISAYLLLSKPRQSIQKKITGHGETESK